MIWLRERRESDKGKEKEEIIVEEEKEGEEWWIRFKQGRKVSRERRR